jgi:hypothetical protein
MDYQFGCFNQTMLLRDKKVVGSLCVFVRRFTFLGDFLYDTTISASYHPISTLVTRFWHFISGDDMKFSLV